MKVSIIYRKTLSHIVTIDVDFIINKTLPQFTYSPNNTINNISVPFHSLSDNVLERFEIAVLEIRLNQTDHFIQIHNSIVQFVTVTILDNTGKIALYLNIIIYLTVVLQMFSSLKMLVIY